MIDPALAALLRAICVNPADDEARLVCADWYEEAAGFVQRCSGTHRHRGKRMQLANGGHQWLAHGVLHASSPTIAHHHCDEKCRVSNGNHERAEFIRLQIELSKIPNNHVPDKTILRRLSLSQRSTELFNAHAREWFITDTTSRFSVDLASRFGWDNRDEPEQVLTVDRGYVCGIRCTVANFVDRKCKCYTPYGSGMIFSERRSGVYEKCEQCAGTGVIPGLARKLFGQCPITTVMFPDSAVIASLGNNTYYLGNLGVFPQQYWRSLEGLPSRQAVLAAASAIAVDYGRSLHDLLPLTIA